MPSQDDPTNPGDRPTVTTPAAQRRVKTSATFSTGEIIAGRYRMVLFIAEGGMGEVYEAEDLELRERVALKTVLPRIAEDRRKRAA